MDPPPARPPAKEVGDAFANKYYTVLQVYPQHLRRFYKDSSKIGRTGNNGMMCLYTLLDIDDENLNGGFDSAEVTSIISQDRQCGGVLVVVGGYSTLKETLKMMNFTQVFLLAPQEKPEGYFVLIDMLHFDDQTILSGSNVIEEKVPETEVTRKEVPETKVTRKEVADGLLGVSEPNDGLEDVSKISDASADVKVIQEGQGQHRSCDPNDDTGNGNNQESQVFTEGSTVHVRNLPPNDTFAKASPVKIDGRQVHVEKMRGQYPSSDPSPEIKADETGNGNNHEDQAVTEGAGICVKNLPPNATIALVRNAFEQFGAIRRDGVEVRNRWGYSYGFIEFEEDNASRMAIEASPVIVFGRRAYVEKKRPAYRSYWKSPSSGQGKIHIRKEMRGTRVYDFWDWQKSKEEQSKRQEEEGGTGVDHSWDYEQVMEEQRKLQEEKMKFQEEKMQLQEEKIKFQEEKMKLEEEKMKKLQEEKTKLQEEKMKKLQEEKTKFQEEKTKLQEEKTKLQAEKMKLQEEQRKKLKEEEENQK